MSTSQTESIAIAIRRTRLRQWIADRFDGSQARFLEDCASRGHEINQGELSGLLKNKSFGEKKARKLETEAAMPPYFLNADQTNFLQRGHIAQEPADAYQHYLWPFKKLSCYDFNEVLTEDDRNAIETMALVLLTARSQPIQQKTSKQSSGAP